MRKAWLICILATLVVAKEDRSAVYETVGQLLKDVRRLADASRNLPSGKALQGKPLAEALTVASGNELIDMEFANKRMTLYERMATLLEKEAAGLALPIEAVTDRDQAKLKQWAAQERQRLADRLRTLNTGAESTAPAGQLTVRLGLEQRIHLLEQIEATAASSSDHVTTANKLIEELAQLRGADILRLRELANQYRLLANGAKFEASKLPGHYEHVREGLRQHAAQKEEEQEEEESEWPE
jgi:hypothetical protein